MNFKKIALALLLIVPFNFFADDLSQDLGGKQEDPDIDALKKWVREKRMVSVKEIGGDLSISGEVRMEMQGINEQRNGIKQRGRGSVTTKPAYAWDIDVSLMLDYRTERTWSSVKIQYDNDMGTANGTTNRIAVTRAYLGGRAISTESFSMDIDCGRRNLGSVFDSKLEFSSILDGAVILLSKAYESIGDFYFSGAGFLVNDRYNHYAYAAELGFLRIANTGFYLKTSFVDWKKNFENEIETLRYNFRILQGIVGYQFTPVNFEKLIKLYFGALCNFSADKIEITDYTKANLGFYTGFSIGKVLKQGDWAFSMDFQYAQAQAVPDFDCGGIKRGNAQGVGFYTTNINGTGDPTTRQTAVGGCNYLGFQADFFYAITNTLTLLYKFKLSNTLDKDIGPNLKYRQFEMKFIYAF